VERLATSFGYTTDELRNQSFPFWEAYRILSYLGPRSLSRRWRVLRRRVRNSLAPRRQSRTKK
jgi:hypothetical protein